MKSKYSNTTKSSVALFMFMLFVCMNNVFSSNHKTKKWCWTKTMVNEPSFVLDTKNGGMNWAYCMNPKKAPAQKFFAIVETSNIAHSETTSSIKILLYGDKGKGKEAYLNQDGFERGHTKKLSFATKDVGDLQRIKLTLEGKQTYRCKKLTIYRGAKRYNFSCLRALAPCTPLEPKKCILEMNVDGHNEYNVAITTGNEKTAGTKSPITFWLIGTKGKGQGNVLTERGAAAASTQNFKIHSIDVGVIKGFTVSIENKGKWKPIKVEITNLKNKKKYAFGLDSIEVMNPGNNPYTYSKHENKVQKKHEKKAQPYGHDVHNPNVGVMNNKDKSNIINLECEQTLENPDPETNWFGPDYPTADVNYSRVIVRCPANCHKTKNAIVYGMGIHPEKTPICMAGIIDKAISLYGGVMSISIFPAFQKYSLPNNVKKIIRGIKIKAYHQKAKKSFVLARVDSVDLVEKDMRILNHKGDLSHQGRLEMRYEGVWGTICSLGNNRKSAKVICRDLGYKDGEWKSPRGTAGKGYCNGFNGGDHCAAKSSKSYFSNIKCEPRDNTFNKCEKILADPEKCGTDYNAIINCYNENYKSPLIIPNKTIRLEAIKKDNKHVRGRLEMYFGGHWKPICNIGFSPQAAKIACQQMGFLAGEIISSKSGARSFFMPMKSKVGFSAMNVACKGKEKNLGGCKMQIRSVNCKHDQDMVLMCNLTKHGDTTGRSQYYKKIPVPPPKLGKLAVSLRYVDCDEKGYDMKYRGDPGSIYVIHCPRYCDRRRGSIWGTGIYTADSNICKAAIYSGVIGTSGGNFALIKTFGQSEYIGKTLMGGIISAGVKKDWPVSFSVSQMNSGWLGQNALMHSSFLEESNTIEIMSKMLSPLSNESHTSNHQVDPQFDDEYLMKSKRYFNQINKMTSFIEMGTLLGASSTRLKKRVYPIFKWVPPSFKHEFKPKTVVVFKDSKIGTRGDYTIIMRFELLSFKKEDTYLFSYPGCGGYNILIRKNGTLALGDLCDNKKLYQPGYQVPLKDPVTLYIRYSNSRIKVHIASEKVKLPFAKEVNIALPLEGYRTCALGSLATDKKKGHFLGKIRYMFIFRGEYSLSWMPNLLKNAEIKGHGVHELMKTVDKRICVSECTDNPVPPSAKAGKPPKEADINGISEESGPKAPKKESKKGDHGKSGDADKSGGAGGAASGGKGGAKGEKDKASDAGGKEGASSPAKKSSDDGNNAAPGSTGTYDKKQKNNIETNKIDCETTLINKKFIGQTGKFFRVHCPNCSKIGSSSVFGTANYHPRSSICKAALHFGALKPGSTGDIVVTLAGAKPMFNGSKGADGTTSGTFGSADESFTVAKASPIAKIRCNTKASDGKYRLAHVNDKFVVHCPKMCSKVGPMKLVGTQVYTDKSFICAAAIHMGIINDLGGEVTFKIDHGQQHYKGSNGFGIISRSSAAHVRSFSFLGLRAAIHYHYEEDFKGDFKNKWKVINSYAPKFKTSNRWAFMENPNFKNALNHEEKVVGIQHTGKIDALGKNKYGSWIILKDKEWANGSVHFNLLFVDTRRPIGFFFRYRDRNNYYSIKIDPSKNLGNLELTSTTNGSNKSYGLKSHTFKRKAWYRFRVDYNYEKIKITIQTKEIREHRVIFEKKLKGIHRGTIGFATKGNTNFITTGIKIGRTNHGFKIDPNNMRSWNVIMKETNLAHRRNYCQDLFPDDKINYHRCLDSHVYCKFRCNEDINEMENLLNFHCYSLCTKQALSEPVKGLNSKHEPVNFLAFIPKVGNKCDYKPLGEKTFFSCVVRSLSQIEKGKFAKIDYTTPNAAKREVWVRYPNSSFLACGKGLKIRSDCEK